MLGGGGGDVVRRCRDRVVRRCSGDIGGGQSINFISGRSVYVLGRRSDDVLGRDGVAIVGRHRVDVVGRHGNDVGSLFLYILMFLFDGRVYLMASQENGLKVAFVIVRTGPGILGHRKVKDYQRHLET